MKIEMKKNEEIVNDEIVDKYFGIYERNGGNEAERQEHEAHRLDPNRISVTDMTFCDRATYYKKTMNDKELEEYPEEFTARVRMTRGILYDDILCGSEKNKFEVETELGQTLVLIPDKIYEDRIMELKTTKNGKYSLEKNDTPTYSAKYQASVYCAFLGYKIAEIIYFDPDNIYKFIIEFTESELRKIRDEVADRAFAISRSLKSKRTPRKQKEGSWKCKGCRFRSKCWGE